MPATHYVLSKSTNQVSRLSLESAAIVAQLDPGEIEWAIEEYGACDTDEYTVTPIGPEPEKIASSTIIVWDPAASFNPPPRDILDQYGDAVLIIYIVVDNKAQFSVSDSWRMF
jgi:hypothetical protein